tara:strand:- start:96 stop:608 length:513 start_codon:yes stop_codon:yes gene_type:complete
MLEIEIVGQGTEFYSYKVKKSSFNEKKFLEKHKQDYFKLNEDNFEMMSYGDKETIITINVNLNGKNIYEYVAKTLKDHNCKISKITKTNYRDFSETGTADKVAIWGHSGMYSCIHSFNDVNKFSIEKLEVFLLELEKEIFINGIAYDDKDPDNAEPHFEPKHGYWGPYIF